MIRRKPTHPGEILLEDVIKPLGLTITEAAQKLGVSRKTLSELVHQKSSLSPGMALRISEATHTSPESWLSMQYRKNQETYLNFIINRRSDDLFHVSIGSWSPVKKIGRLPGIDSTYPCYHSRSDLHLLLLLPPSYSV